MLGKFVSAIKEFGPAAGMLYVADRALRTLSPRLGLFVYELVAQPIPDKPLLPANMVRKLSFSEIEPGHLALAQMPVPAAVIQARFDQNALCLGAWRGDVLLGYIWLCFDRYREDEIRCDYLISEVPGSVFDFDLYILPEHRMGLAFAAVWHGANEYLRARGVLRSFSRLTRFNNASRRSHARFKWQRVGRVIVFVAWRLEVMLTDIAPYLAVSTSRRRRVQLRLRPADAATPASVDAMVKGPIA